MIRVLLLAAVAFGVLVGAAPAQVSVDQSKETAEIFTSPNQATNSDLAFWGKHAFVGYYTGDTGFPPATGARGGVRIFDVSDPASPRLVRDFACDANENDPIVWDRNGNGVADLLLLAVDRTMASPNCGAPRSPHNDRNGWEGVRIFELSDDPANPFRTITPVKMQYTDCGAQTITAWTGFAEDPVNPRLIVYASSYPLLAGPTCGQANFNNVTNPYDADKVVNDPLHRQIQVLSVPLNNPAAATEIAQPRIVYPGDPDGRTDWCERGVCSTPAAPLEPAAVGCQDIVVHMGRNLAGGACAEQGQVWAIDPITGIPDTENPIIVGDDDVTSGGRGQFPGAVDFFNSVRFNNAGTVVNWVDESLGSGCPPITTYQPRPWNPAGGTHETGRMFFTGMDGGFLSEFQVGDVRPNPGATEYCSAHKGMAALGIDRDLLVNAWYAGGVNVIDFTQPTALDEIAYFDPARASGTWSAYPYSGPLFSGDPGEVPIYASDGVLNNAIAPGMVVYRTNKLPNPGSRGLAGHLNPQTMDHEVLPEPPPAPVPPPEPPPPAPPSPPPAPPLLPPALDLTGLFITPKAFAALGSGPSALPAQTQAQGGVVQYRLTKGATVTFVVERVLVGRTRAGRCAVSGAARKPGARCVRYDYAGRFTQAGVAGVNRVRFAGRVNGTALPVGRYRLKAIAAEGLELLAPRTVRFRITAAG